VPSGVFVGGRQKGLPAPLPPRGFPAAPLRAIPDKYFGAQRGKREKHALLRNVRKLSKKLKILQPPSISPPGSHFVASKT